MKKLLTALYLITTLTVSAWSPQRTDLTLWYNQPAQQWEETLPLGNGRLGMMPDGGIKDEKIVLNEISMWSGSVADYSNPEASKSLPEIQELLKAGRNKEAQELMFASFVPSKPELGGTYGSYQMLADLDIDYSYTSDATVANYHRWLDLSEATAYTTFVKGDVTYLREYYVPRAQNVMIIHLSADSPSSISMSATLNRMECGEMVNLDNDILSISGTLDSGKEGTDGVKYKAYARIIAVGAKASTKSASKTIRVDSADEVWIAITATTDYWETLGIDHQSLIEDLNAITTDTLSDYHRTGINEHRRLFGRTGINLPHTETSMLPTDQRIISFQECEDPELAALYYNYGRYLLICSTLPGFLPPNLQGLWANECGTPWNGDYHTNINVQMNHWPVEPNNLSELHEPLIKLVERAIPSGQRSAKAFYGDKAQGWVMHMMTNVWQYTEPGEHPLWGATNTGGAWLCAHLWEHYLYNPTDTVYLREIYPVMKGASEFFASTMITEPKHGWTVTGPSSSPENQFFVPGTRDAVSVCMGPTMDTQLVHELFTNVSTAASILGIDSEYAATLDSLVSTLPPMQIDRTGRLMEWLEEYEEHDPQHRHVSHLYGLHPGNQISAIYTPELAEACRNTLEVRGDGGTGWSRAWKINFWARLGDGDRAYKLFKSLLYPAYTHDNPKHISGTFPNLMCSHPPMQMDGNWGGTSGITEMLIQSQDGIINLLPALPAAWSEGSFFGLKARGGAIINLCWADSLPTTMIIDSPYPETIRVPIGITAAKIGDKTINIENQCLNVPAGTTTCIFYSNNK